MTENYVHNEMLLQGLKPYFWRSGNTAEVDFVFEQDGRIIPVEVKSADNTMAKRVTGFFASAMASPRVSSFRSRTLRSMSTTTAAKQ